MSRRRRRYDDEEQVELEKVLEPYQQWNVQQESVQEEYADDYAQYDDIYAEEYSDEHEALDSDTRFRMAMGLFDLISIFVGIVVILILVAMLVSLANWLQDDILHSALLMQSGLQ